VTQNPVLLDNDFLRPDHEPLASTPLFPQFSAHGLIRKIILVQDNTLLVQVIKIKMKFTILFTGAIGVFQASVLASQPARKRIHSNPKWHIEKDVEFGRNFDALEEILNAEVEISR